MRTNLHRHRFSLITAAVAVVAFALTWLSVFNEVRAPRSPMDWPTFVVVAGLLIVCERTPSTWIRVGPAGVVTPRWMFAFGLMLIGSPSMAVGVALIGATVHSITQPNSIQRTVMRIGGTAIALASAALMLTGLGVHGSITKFESVPWRWSYAVVAAGVTIIMLNSAVAAVTMAVQRRISFLSLMRRGLGVRITAEGTLLSLAPLWVIGTDFSVVLAPLLAITTILVFRSTQQALERSQEAHHDALTGLYNRRAFLEQLDETLDESVTAQQPTTLVMDLDGFKGINDRLGHQLGDSVLIAFADRLELSLPPNSVAARFGGDEFAVLLPDPDDGDAHTQITGLHAALLAPLTIEDFPVTVGVSMGAATAPADGRTSRELLRAADLAMYQAKRTGSAVAFHDGGTSVPQSGRRNLLSDLGEALQNHELYIHFQPQLKMASGDIDTVEALVRWRHPEHGSIPPDDFIGLAEETDLIGPIAEMVLRVATRGLINSGVTSRLAVNVSPRNLQDPNFAAVVMAILEESGFRADRLELEVAEQSIVNNAERCRSTVEQLRAQGVRIAIDDFGIGYSSFQALRVLQVDRVKIDSGFVSGILDHPRDRLIVASVIQLAHDLDLDVVAEGVETTELWDALAELDCDVAQGYGIAMPMGYPELRGWLSSWSEVVVAETTHPTVSIGRPRSMATGRSSDPELQSTTSVIPDQR